LASASHGPSADLTSQNVGNDQGLVPDAAASPARFQMSPMLGRTIESARIGNYSERRACNLISGGRGHCSVNLICPVTWPSLAPTPGRNGEISARGERPAEMVGTYRPLLGPCGVRSDGWPVSWSVLRD